MTPGLGIEPGTHWWEASTLTTAPGTSSILAELEFVGVVFCRGRKTGELEEQGKNQQQTQSSRGTYQQLLTI